MTFTEKLKAAGLLGLPFSWGAGDAPSAEADGF
jgi:hypothetical protein